jgi:hypothetical protein
MIRVVARSLWTFPTTLVGLGLGAACMPFGTRFQFHSGVIEFHSGGIAWLLEHATLLEGGALAITFGDVVLARTPHALEITRDHERVHVRQCHRWGPFFIPAYLTASLIAYLRKQDAYRDNPFEKEAYAMSDARSKLSNG